MAAFQIDKKNLLCLKSLIWGEVCVEAINSNNTAPTLSIAALHHDCRVPWDDSVGSGYVKVWSSILFNRSTVNTTGSSGKYEDRYHHRRWWPTQSWFQPGYCSHHSNQLEATSYWSLQHFILRYFRLLRLQRPFRSGSVGNVSFM